MYLLTFISDLNKPSIITPNTTVFQEYSKIVMKCSVVTLPSARFSWQINGTKTSHNSDTLILSNSSMYDSGRYECIATNGFKTMKSDPFHLHVNRKFHSVEQNLNPFSNKKGLKSTIS